MFTGLGLALGLRASTAEGLKLGGGLRCLLADLQAHALERL